MKRIIYIILAGIFLFSSVSRFGVYLSFQLNKEYIAENLCENRFDKNSCCKGKCYLEKELKKHDQQESKSKKENLRVDDLIAIEWNELSLLTPIELSDIAMENYSFFYLYEYAHFTFHPPSLSFLS